MGLADELGHIPSAFVFRKRESQLHNVLPQVENCPVSLWASGPGSFGLES